jgi:hypothetical protein
MQHDLPCTAAPDPASDEIVEFINLSRGPAREGEVGWPPTAPDWRLARAAREW